MNLIKWLKLVVVLFLITVSFFYYLHDLINHPMHEDEHAWVERGAVFFEQYFLEKKPTNPIWSSYFSYDQPKLGEYLFGAFTYLNYGILPTQLLENVDFGGGSTDQYGFSQYESSKWWVANQANNQQYQYIPNDAKTAYLVIVHNRILSIIFVVLGLFFIYLLINKSVNFFQGIITYIFLAQHLLIHNIARHAMADSFLFFFLTSSLYFFYQTKSVNIYNVKKLMFIYMGLGIWVGLATSVKLNAVMFGVIGFLWLCWHWLKKLVKTKKSLIGKKIRHIFAYLLLFILSISITFTVLNPFIWTNPIKNTKFLLTWRAQTAADMAKSNPQSAYPTIKSRLWGMVDETILPKEWNQRTFPRLPKYSDLALVIIGSLYLFIRSIKNKDLFGGYILFWTLGIIIFLCLYLIVNYDRYFMPIIPFWVIIEAYAIGKSIEFIYTKTRILILRFKQLNFR